MKRHAIFIAVLFLFCVNAFAADAPEMNEKDRISYSVGYQIGGDFKKQNVELDPELLVKGINDALAGTEPVMAQEDMRETLMELKRKIVAAQQKDMKEKSEKNLAEGKAFLAENGKKEGVVTLPSGLQYKVIKEGAGASPTPDDTVSVHYRGTLIDGTEFDNSYARNEPAVFKADRVIPGWKEALQMMKEGGKWQLFIPPDLAYGERQAGQLIGPNSALLFEVELVSVKKADGEQKSEK